MSAPALTQKNDKLYLTIIGVLSVVVPVLVAVFLYLPEFFKISDGDFSFLPHLNAMLNSATALCLIAGYYFVKKGNQAAHKTAMYTAFSLSALFLVSYVIYHSQGNHTLHPKDNPLHTLYIVLLISHIILSAIVLPLVLSSIYFAVTNRLEKHRKIVKWSWPVWLYVAVSGVAVYAMISPYYV